MIRELHIKNLSIVASASVELQKGFHVISGETGAGKSILLQAIAFALGARADAESIRSGADEASVTLLLEENAEKVNAQLQALGLATTEDGLVYLRRTLNRAGRSRAFLNDEPVTLKTLQSLGQAFIHIVAQHASQELFDEKFLLASLDRFGNLQSELAAYQKVFDDYRESRQNFRELSERVKASQAEEEMLRYQFAELEKAQLKAGEVEELESTKKRLKHRVALAQQTFEIRELLNDADDSASDRLGKALNLAEKASFLDPSLASLRQGLQEAMELLENSVRSLNDYSSDLEDPSALDGLEDRLAELSELQRKYRLDVAGLIQKKQELQQKLSELDQGDDLLKSLEENFKKAEDDLRKSAGTLHKQRKKAAEKLSAQLEKNLKALALNHATVVFELKPMASAENYREQGGDELTLQVSFNPGEPLRPLAEVVSGGELSRLLLAFCELLYPPEALATLIFDEVDAGVGGKVAELIGKKLKLLSKKAQVLCVTHLPQIASQGDWHYTVEKEVKQGRTFSQIRQLESEERVSEVARMLAGVKITEQALSHAREMLSEE